MSEYYGGYGELWYNNTIEVRMLMHAYNNTAPNELKKRFDILKKVLAQVYEDSIFEPPFHVDKGFRVKVGKRFYANYNLSILDSDLVTIGDNVKLGPNVVLAAASHPVHPEGRKCKDHTVSLMHGPITIEDDVWIGANTTVLPNVTIGKGSVIGAGSVVNKSIPPMTIAVGSPCKILRAITDKDLPDKLKDTLK